MSKEIILKIKETEAEAQRIKNDAASEATERVRRAEADGKALCEHAEAEAARVNRSKLAVARERAEGAIESTRQAALDEAKGVRESAEFNVREAVRLIIAGVYEQCQ